MIRQKNSVQLPLNAEYFMVSGYSNIYMKVDSARYMLCFNHITGDAYWYFHNPKDYPYIDFARIVTIRIKVLHIAE